MHHVITLQGCSPRQNLRRVQHWHCRNFLKFQANPRLNCLLNRMIPQELPTLYCNCTGRFSTSKFCSILTLVWPFGTFKLADGHLPDEHNNTFGIATSCCNFTWRVSTPQSRSDWWVLSSDMRSIYFCIMNSLLFYTFIFQASLEYAIPTRLMRATLITTKLIQLE